MPREHPTLPGMAADRTHHECRGIRPRDARLRRDSYSLRDRNRHRQFLSSGRLGDQQWDRNSFGFCRGFRFNTLRPWLFLRRRYRSLQSATLHHPKTAALSISVTPAPPPEQAIAGTYSGDLHDYEYRKTSPPTVLADKHLTAQSFIVKATGVNAATISGWLDGLGSCDSPITVNANGTFTFSASFWCPQTCLGSGYPCPCFAFGILDGSGTWDYTGHLSFLTHADLSSSCGDVYGDETFTNGHQ